MGFNMMHDASLANIIEHTRTLDWVEPERAAMADTDSGTHGVSALHSSVKFHFWTLSSQSGQQAPQSLQRASDRQSAAMLRMWGMAAGEAGPRQLQRGLGVDLCTCLHLPCRLTIMMPLVVVAFVVGGWGGALTSSTYST